MGSRGFLKVLMDLKLSINFSISIVFIILILEFDALNS